MRMKNWPVGHVKDSNDLVSRAGEIEKECTQKRLEVLDVIK
jgi:hypothetical protein